MAEVKWIKITTNMFEDEKIDFIESLPESDAILIIWIKLLTIAGKCNGNGYIYLTETIPYDENMLAHKFKRPLNIVRLALDTFERLGMIQRSERGFYITNWEKHQNISGMEKIKEQNRLRKQNQREREKNQQLLECHVTSHADVTQCHDTDIDKDINNINIINNISAENNETVDSIVDKPKKEPKKTYGEFEKVKLTDIEYNKLTDSLGETITLEFISRLDTYKASTGKTYKSDYATILNWYRKEPNKTGTSKPPAAQPKPNKFHNFDSKIASMGNDKLEEMAKKRFEEKLKAMKGAAANE